MKRSLIMMAALTLLLALFVPLASAKTIVPGPVAQDPASEEAAAYKAWYDAYKAQDLPKELELGKAFVEKFSGSKNADYVKKDIARVRSLLFNQAVQAKNTAEIIRIGKDVLAQDPDNLDYLIALSIQIRQNELFATPANYAHAAEATDFTERTIRLIDAGKTPTGADPKLFNQKVTLAFMHQTLAVIYDHEKNVDKALAEYDKAASLDPSNAAFFFHCGRIHNDKYAAGAQKYEAAQKKAEAAQKKSDDLQKKVQAVPEADRTAATKPEVKTLLADAKAAQDESKAAQDEEKAALADVNTQADAVITCWARFLGLTADPTKNPWGPTRAQIEKAFTDLYKYRHNDSTDGLQKLIDQNRPNPAASNGDAAAATVAKP